MSQLKNQAQSISKKLSNIAKDLKVAFPKILTEFLLERLAARLLSHADLAERLVFKGGYVSLRVYKSPRYTIDLDALLRKGNLDETVKTARAAVEKNSNDAVWFILEKTIDLETQGEYGGIRLVFRTGIGEVIPLKRAQIVHLDIGKGDPIIPGPIKVETPFLLGGGSLTWQVYPIETTASEKLHALIIRGSESSRSKDIFDLNLLLKQCDKVNLMKSLTETFRHRGDPLPESIAQHIQKTDRKLLKMGWASAVSDIPGAQDFDQEFNELLKQLNKLFL